MAMSRSLLPLSLGISALLCAACGDGNHLTEVAPTNLSHILLDNWSFESGSNPSLNGWTVYDTTAARVIAGAPSGGGAYALAIDALWMPPVAVEARLIPSVGTHRYDLTFWGYGKGAAREGSAQLLLKHQDSVLPGTVLRVTDTVWTHYAVSDTFTAVAGDTILIRLAGPPTELGTGTAYFDLIRLATPLLP
jgi:hypothetical protein